ncbi:PEP-CTERM sorting domain-containing protein [Massilia sp. CCM 8733]|uniref:PEP-CTERM sorting domain-containing protein n=1 Tax=Massilia mucilaginosa TaxID=2609282 RepID=A0ABX0NVJ6_9BURK|nr:PEP-CTERM sorting domain-containing protein [Massilia mucilaginosa]NHZ90754.1 PEP-CTERM sorting domain-containing protein [Massilia mucilaginosa]
MLFERLRLTVVLLCTFACLPAQAALVADTGTPTNGIGAGWAFNSGHSYAGRFTVPGAMTINSVEGYFGTDAGEVGISLFGNSADGEGGFIPGSMLRSASFATGVGEAAWRGLAGLDWAVGEGSYWIGFTSTWDSASQASMPGAADKPLAGYALEQGGQWYDAAGLGLDQGLRVDASAMAVPEPGSMALFGLGLGVVGVVGRRKRA